MALALLGGCGGGGGGSPPPPPPPPPPPANASPGGIWVGRDATAGESALGNSESYEYLLIGAADALSATRSALMITINRM